MRKSNSDRPSSTDQTPPPRIKACAYIRMNPRACAYIRFSTDEEAEAYREAQRKRLLEMAERNGYEVIEGPGAGDDISLQTQRERLINLAAREECEIIEWYVDEGYSGADPKRPGWCKLLADAPTAEWTVILSLNRTRFSRVDSIEEGDYMRILREAGKRLYTAIEGPVNWDATAPLHTAIEGKSFGGVCPYGYACLIVDPQGYVRRVSRQWNWPVPQGWSKVVVPVLEEIEIVQRLFHTYASTDVSVRYLKEQLAADCVPYPFDGEWLASILIHLLADDAYVGDTRIGGLSSSSGIGGLSNEPIISRDVWNRVQEKLNYRRK